MGKVLLYKRTNKQSFIPAERELWQRLPNRGALQSTDSIMIAMWYGTCRAS